MLLKLIPPNAEPTIHFTIVFRDVPAHLPTPPAWTAQYNHLVVEDLEVPPKLISLDKAAGLITLIDEVVFDLGQRKVSCLFADGLTEEWEMGVTGNELSPLQEVITLVQESTHEDERERERVREREREKQLALQMQKQAAEKQRSSSRFSSSGVQPAAKGKHKKQRSLFMQFVSYVAFSLLDFLQFRSTWTQVHHQPELSVVVRQPCTANVSGAGQLPAVAYRDVQSTSEGSATDGPCVIGRYLPEVRAANTAHALRMVQSARWLHLLDPPEHQEACRRTFRRDFARGWG